MKYNKKIAAFTMVEMAIVLSIIGILIAATISALALIRNAEVKTFLSEVQRMQTALGNFQSTYNGLPGDIPDASSYWTGTADGDSDGTIDAETSNEPFRALQQLYLANLIEGAYAGFTGTWGSGFTLASKDVTGSVIESKARVGAALYAKCCSTTDYSRTISFNNHISIFKVNSDITKRSGVLTPIEALEIDTKIDDGVPDTGLVGGSGSWSGVAYVATGCYSSTGSSSFYLSADATYKDQNGCQMQFAFDWN